jgi:hypothetical protein
MGSFRFGDSSGDLDRLSSQIGEPRQTPLDGQGVHTAQESLQTLEVGLSLSSHERRPVSSPRL